ncbi:MULTISPECIES: DUF4382 domain-containing protein [Sphingobacterium]|uniref:DUF4382 domain-containing protein n=1 Tax=Sphingobacterium tenebrionis TaxID=3111775 RepID=A0ABU8I4X7_9SPHI|nr:MULTISPECIES: DUF4382 domain-containing protein [unclassified Sphingobacterium]QBR11498.1 DUF4382 domain-containing protein [Sphingobacterium sp. CZ-2]
MRTLLSFALAAAALSFASCSNDDGMDLNRTTPVTIKMTDAPGYYDQIFLNIDHIEILSAGGNKTVDIDDDPFDILLYRLGRDTVLANADVPSGQLQEIRLVLEDEGNEVVIDGVRHQLTTPSGQSSGVKIKVQDNLEPGVAYTLLLDFDASKSIHMTGNGKYMLKPVIRAIPVAVSGAVKGIVSPKESLANLLLINGADTLGTLADTLGNFYFPGVKSGTYKLLVQPTVTPYLEKTIMPIEVANGEVKDLGTIGVN